MSLPAQLENEKSEALWRSYVIRELNRLSLLVEGSGDSPNAESVEGFSQSDADGIYLAKASNLSDVSDAGTARTNLGLGSMSTEVATNYLTKAGNLSGIASTATARSNLGLGSMSTQAASNVAITGGSISGITDLAVADGGTGASDATNARSNLGLGTMATQASNNVSITGGSISGITDLAVADGGTGASNAADAKTNLQLAYSTTESSVLKSYSVHGVAKEARLQASHVLSGSYNYSCIVEATEKSSGSNDLAIYMGGPAGAYGFATTFSMDGSYNIKVDTYIGSGTSSGVIRTSYSGGLWGGSSYNNLGFFNTAPVAKQTVADLTSYTAGATYTSNEQNMLNHHQTKLQAVIDALQAYGLF